MVTWDERSNQVIHQVRSICPTCTVQYRIQYCTVKSIYSTSGRTFHSNPAISGSRVKSALA